MQPSPVQSRPRLLALGLLPLLLSLTACAIPDRLRADRELKRLCSIPDRIVVYEVVQLPASSFTENGRLRVVHKQGTHVIADDFTLNSAGSTLLLNVPKHSLRLTRYRYQLVRISTGAVLAEYTSYCRAGGDSFAPNNTSECCPDDPNMNELALRRAEP